MNPNMFVVDPDVYPAHNVFTFDSVTFSSNFDNGNLARVERVGNKLYEFKIWSAPDNMGTEYQSKHCAWFHFVVTGLPMGCVLRIQVVNASNHSGLYKHDMRPVYKSNTTNQKWTRIKTSVRFQKENDSPQLFFEHSVDAENDKISFAFTYPYSYTQLQQELEQYDQSHTNTIDVEGSLYYKREILTRSGDGRRVDLITVTSTDGIAKDQHEPLLSGLFPDNMNKFSLRPHVFPNKEVVFVSARVHPGEVPAQHTFKGILQLLMDPDDLCGKALRERYVFKLIPMLNPDGVYRGHFRMDQHGHNLNRYYNAPDPLMQPSIFAAKSLLDYYAKMNTLTLYLDFHAHASKRGCFIYGNVLDTIEDQVQNQLFCKLISLNTPHFDYEGCLFSKEHMFRIDPGDQAKGLTAEGSGRVNTYLAYGLVHSYTIECNYNTSRIGNEVAPPDQEIGGQNVTPSSPFTTNPEKYTPSIYQGVGRACVIAMLDLRGQNPCSRIPKSKFKSLDRVRNAVIMEVRSRKEYFGKKLDRERRRSVQERRIMNSSPVPTADDWIWRRVVELEGNNNNNGSEVPLSARSGSAGGQTIQQQQQQQQQNAQQNGRYLAPSEMFFISASAGPTKRKASCASTPLPSSDPPPVKTTIEESSNSGKYVLSPGKRNNIPNLFSANSFSNKYTSNSEQPSRKTSPRPSSSASHHSAPSSPVKPTSIKGFENIFNGNTNNQYVSGSATPLRDSYDSAESDYYSDYGSEKINYSTKSERLPPSSSASENQDLNQNNSPQSEKIRLSRRADSGIAFVERTPGNSTKEKSHRHRNRHSSSFSDHGEQQLPQPQPEGVPRINVVVRPRSNTSSPAPALNNPTPPTNSQQQQGQSSQPLEETPAAHQPLNSIGTSMRDLIREHSINKMIKLSSNPLGNLSSFKNETGSSTSSLVQNSNPTSSNPQINASPSSSSKKVVAAPAGNGQGLSTRSGSNKDNRKILGKTLHAAGVALLINGTNSSSNLNAENDPSNQHQQQSAQQQQHQQHHPSIPKPSRSASNESPRVGVNEIVLSSNRPPSGSIVRSRSATPN